MTAAQISVVAALRRLAKENPNRLLLNEAPLYLRRIPEPGEARVAVISGGGSGHEPMHTGFVGRGMLDAACPGHVFTSPSVDQITSAARATEAGRGCLFIVKNYPGDRMNFRLALEELPFEAEIVLVDDDIALPADLSDSRRGIAGTFVVEKIAGAAAARGYDLKTCAGLARKAVSSTRSIAVAWRWCSRRVNGRLMFELPQGRISYGVGLHGEQGVELIPDMSDVQVVVRMLDDLLREVRGICEREHLLLLTNGLSADVGDRTRRLHGHALQELERRNVGISRETWGTFATCLNMQGFSLTLALFDDELLSMWDAGCDLTPEQRSDIGGNFKCTTHLVSGH